MSNVDYIGASELILRSFEEHHEDVALTSDGRNMNPSDFAKHLKNYFDDETIEEFVETEVGRGVLLGMCVVYEALGVEVDDERAESIYG